MGLRKIYMPEDSVYDAVTQLPEPTNNHTKKVAYTYDSYDSYPEKNPVEKIKVSNFEGIIELPLGEEYRLQPKIDNYCHQKNHDTVASSALNEEINNMAVKWVSP